MVKLFNKVLLLINVWFLLWFLCYFLVLFVCNWLVNCGYIVGNKFWGVVFCVLFCWVKNCLFRFVYGDVVESSL